MRSRRGLGPRVLGLWQSMLFNRSVIPTPQSYTLAGAIGLAGGVVAQLVIGWPWWLGPIVFVVAAFLAALSTAFRGRQRRETFDRFRDIADPGGAMRRHEERRRQMLLESSFEVLGLAEHPDPPRLGGSGHNGENLTSLTVVYGDPRQPDASTIDVETTIRQMPVEFMLEMAADELRHHAAGPVMLGKGDPTMLSAAIEWNDIDVTVDEIPHDASVASLGEHWRVVADLGQRVVTVGGSSVPVPEPLELRAIDPGDVQPLS